MKTFKFFIILTVTSILFARGFTPAFAQNALGGRALIHSVSRFQNQASRAAQLQQYQLQNVISRADTLISNRLTSLNTILTRVQNDNNLSASEKSSLTLDIQTEINGLTTLKSKIDADTDVTTARSDAKQIITGYYVYVMFEPKTRLLIVLNNLQTQVSYLQALVSKIQNLINTLQSQGNNNIASLQSILNDVSSQLQTVSTTLTNDTTTVQNVSISTQTPSTVFNQVRQDITQIVKEDFAKIQSDFQQMRPLFRSLILTRPSITVMPSPVQTTSPTSAPSSTP